MPHKVLIADDSELLRNQLMKDLENGGFQVLAAANGGEGILLAKENPDVAVIIADFNMPDIDGLTMIERIYQMRGKKDIPALVLSTESSQHIVERGRMVGIRAWMTKPFNAAKMVKALHAVIAARKEVA